MFFLNKAEASSDDVLMSLGRALTNMPDLTDKFYIRLLADNEEIQNHFKNTDFTKQRKLLNGAISMVVLFDSGDETAHRVLSEIRRTHCKKMMNIRPELYKVWEDCLISLIVEADPECNKPIENEWRRIVSKATDFISGGYESGK